MRLLSQFRTSKQLGWRNCASVVVHRIGLRTGFYQFLLPSHCCPEPQMIAGPAYPANFQSEPWFEISSEACFSDADILLSGLASWFSNEVHEIGFPRIGFMIRFRYRFADGSHHWSRCKPFVAADIKRCWELSRWGWAPLLARAWRLSGDSRYFDALNAWILSWCQANPVNAGCNWLCGQEASIRLLHALQSWQLIDGLVSPNPNPERAAFVFVHLQRIAATVRYAQAQDNNHWVSEAAALFIGGEWLATTASTHVEVGRRWATAGRRALELSVDRLVLRDGSFSQHSLVYHRLVLDTLSLVELWCRWLDLKPFSERFYERCHAALVWFESMVDPISGDGPNLGSNDGAFCFQLHSQPYRDFRPTLQLASVLFRGNTALPPGPGMSHCIGWGCWAIPALFKFSRLRRLRRSPSSRMVVTAFFAPPPHLGFVALAKLPLSSCSC